MLLLDEPLGALDQKLRKEVQVELKALQRKLGITFVFVTHDQEEALTMSDRIAVMNAGRVEQVDAAGAGLRVPADRVRGAVHGRLRTSSPPPVRGHRRGPALARHARRRQLPVPAIPAASRPGDAVRFVVRPEKLDLRSRDLSTQRRPLHAGDDRGPRLPGRLDRLDRARATRGERFVIYEQNEQPFEERGKFAEGGTAYLCWNPRHTVLMRPTERRRDASDA